MMGEKLCWDLGELYAMTRHAESVGNAARRLARAACRGGATICMTDIKLLRRQAVRRRRDIEIWERKLIRRIVFVADHPRLDDDVFDPEREQHPR